MNQHDPIQDGTETEPLADLPLTEEQADQPKAGSQLFRESLCGEGKKVTIHY